CAASFVVPTFLFLAPPTFPNKCANRTNHAHRSQSGKRVAFRHIGRTSVSAYGRGNKHSNPEPNPHCNPPYVVHYLRRLRSHLRPAIYTKTPVAATPEKASISGTSTWIAWAPTVVAI